MFTIPPGTSNERRVLVTNELAISFLGAKDARVFSTPDMIHQMEWCARDAIKPILGAEYDTVGTAVNVRHLAATPVGMRVTLRAEVLECDGRRVTFRVEAHDEKEKVGEGTHERFIVNVAKFAQRIREKRQS
jgi:fluoroacetyl-CoA thioesterase